MMLAAKAATSAAEPLLSLMLPSSRRAEPVRPCPGFYPKNPGFSLVARRKRAAQTWCASAADRGASFNAQTLRRPLEALVRSPTVSTPPQLARWASLAG